ncbi:helix-turn-helix domain-containing protein [Clostridium sp. VAP51]|uniref:winged helix-turn-helix transcriptional regulator n=1 Tax=Clostridium sp. VAP51 TaxID=2949978 RepID=UPI00207A5C49|nr:helix-turn-helix domain-containing protein [Clostridium sp. VAP51]
MIKYNNKEYVCLLDLAMDFIRSKWKAVILCHLLNEPKRFLELQRITNGVSHKVLTEKLKELEEDNLIQKIVYDENPPKVEYKLTPMGKDLSMAIKEIEKWSLKYYGNIIK